MHLTYFHDKGNTTFTGEFIHAVLNQHDGHKCMSLYIEKKHVCYVLLVCIRHMILPSTNEGLDFTPCGRIQYVYTIISQ